MCKPCNQTVIRPFHGRCCGNDGRRHLYDRSCGGCPGRPVTLAVASICSSDDGHSSHREAPQQLLRLLYGGSSG
eukprot:6673289-Prymnesium_polylepis.1